MFGPFRHLPRLYDEKSEDGQPGLPGPLRPGVLQRELESAGHLQSSMKRIDFVFFDAGGGHRAAANALKLAIEQTGKPWQVRLVNLQETLDRLDIIRQVTGLRMQDVYNLLLRKGWTLGSEYMVPPMHWLIRMNHARMVKFLVEFWAQDAPDLLVSVVPNFNRTLHEAYHRAKPGGKMVTVLTDMADYPPDFWIERGQRQWFICGTEKAVEQARAMGHPAEYVLPASGMVLHPRFYQPPPVDRVAERRRLGLDPVKHTGLVMFGGYGSSTMLNIARRVSAAKLDVQLIFICGKNQKLKAQLKAEKFSMPVFIEGFTSEVPYYMQLADFFVGKPGPGSISEALQMKLPVIVERNAWTLPQERFNTDWVLEKRVGMVLSSFDQIAQAIQDLPVEQYRAHAAALNNRAVFEIPEMLERILG